MSSRTIAVLGLGAMGSRIAMNLIRAGHPVTVWNRSPQAAAALKGATMAASPKKAAETADIVISMVTDDDASKSIWLNPDTGAIWGLKQNAIAIESSTLTVEWTQTLAAKVKTHGAQFLDAPVVGSRPQADAGQLIYLVGGEPTTLAQVQDVLAATSGAIHPVGDIGQGMAMKLAVNALFGIQVAAIAELLAMLSKAGISTEKAMDCLGSLPVTSPAAKGVGNLMVANQHRPMFPIELVEKDLGYVVHTAKSVNTLIPTTKRVRTVYQTAIAQGYGNENITGVVNLFMP